MRALWRRSLLAKCALLGALTAAVLAVVLPLALTGHGDHSTSADTPSVDVPLQWIAGPACGINDPRDDLSNEKVFFNTELPASAVPIGADPSYGSTDAWQVSSDAGGGVLAYSEVSRPGEDVFLEITCPDNHHVEKDLSQQ